MEFKIIDGKYTVSKIREVTQVDFTREFVFLSKTDDELSLVCPTESVPEDTVEREDGWRAFKIEGQLDFGLIGIIARISTILAEQKISVFVVSTYNTDYVLIKEEKFAFAVQCLSNAGYSTI